MIPLRLVKRLACIFYAPHLAEFLVHRGHTRATFVERILHRIDRNGILAHDLLEQFAKFVPVGNAPFFGEILGPLDIVCKNGLLVACHMRNFYAGARLTFAALDFQFQRLPLEFNLQFLELVRLEKLAENIDTLVRRRKQQLQKVALRNHRDLRELLAGHPDDTVYRFRHRLVAAYRTARGPHLAGGLGIIESRRRAFLRHALAAHLGAFVFGIAHHAVFPARIGESQVHECRGIGRRIQATEMLGVVTARIAAAPARRPEKRKSNRIENRRLAGTRIARNQEEPARPELVQFYHGLFGIRAECGNHKPGRSHPLSPQMPLIKSWTNSVSSAFIARPLRPSKNSPNNSIGFFSSTASAMPTSAWLRVRSLS